MQTALVTALLATTLAGSPAPAQSNAPPQTAVCARVTPLDPSDEDSAREAAREIARTLDRWADALRSEDIDSLTRLVAPSAEFWSHAAPPLRGGEALAAAFRSVFDRFNMEQDFECVELIVAGELAVLRGTEINRLVGEEAADTLTVRQRAFSILFRGSDGEWAFARGMTNLPPEPAVADSVR